MDLRSPIRLILDAARSRLVGRSGPPVISMGKTDMSAPSVDVQIAARYRAEIDLSWLRKVALATLREEGETESLVMSLVVMDDAGIRDLKRQFRGVDAPTDVLAFAAEEDEVFIAPNQGPPFLGDVVISYPRALAQAGEQGHQVRVELALLVVHGILHLLGYDDEEEGARSMMCARQQEILDVLKS